MKTNTHVRQSRRGFTLMEVLLVLAILVGLMALVTPKILGTQKKADISNAKAQVGMFKASLERYALDMKDFPSTEQGLKSLIEAPTEEEGTTKWSGPYVGGTDLPKDPWGNEYQYEYPATHGKGDQPDIWSLGPDGEDNTDDDIVSWTKESETEVAAN